MIAPRTEHLTARRRDQVADLYRRGESVKVIADFFGITESHVTKLARSRDIPQRCPNRGRRQSTIDHAQGAHSQAYGNFVWDPGRGGRTIAVGGD